MESSGENPRPYSGRREGPFLLLLIALSLIGGFLIGFMGDQVITKYWGQPPISPTLYTAQPGTQTTLDPVNLQLVKRVEDGVTYINVTLKAISIMATLLAIALGLSIWKTRDYTVALLDEHFLGFKRDQLQPILEDAQAKLDGLSNQGTLVILKTSHVLLDELIQADQKMYQRHLQVSGILKDDASKLLRDREESFRKSKQITEYLIASLSRDPMIVQDVSQKLFALTRQEDEAVLNRADAILAHMRGLSGTWPQASEPRMEIRSLIDELERRKPDDSLGEEAETL